MDLILFPYNYTSHHCMSKNIHGAIWITIKVSQTVYRDYHAFKHIIGHRHAIIEPAESIWKANVCFGGHGGHRFAQWQPSSYKVMFYGNVPVSLCMFFMLTIIITNRLLYRLCPSQWQGKHLFLVKHCLICEHKHHENHNYLVKNVVQNIYFVLQNKNTLSVSYIKK